MSENKRHPFGNKLMYLYCAIAWRSTFAARLVLTNLNGPACNIIQRIKKMDTAMGSPIISRSNK